jgi:two-component system OmpR family sensor kinase
MKGLVDLFGVGALMGHVEWDLAGTLLNGTVAAWAARLAVRQLTAASDQSSAHIAEYESALVRAKDTLSLQDAWREELTHDARNALAGLRAALHTLQRYDASLDAPTQERLRSAAMGQLGHLEDMIIRGPGRETVDFDIAEAIRPTIETRRASGLEVEVHDFSCEAHGHPADLATVVQNILVNAQRHAPGARVRVCVVPAGHKVHLYIADDGPGLSEDEAARVFERGSRGQDSAGSGLGLFVARSLMRQQGGDVELRGHFEGAVFVVTMPAAKGLSAGVAAVPHQWTADAGARVPLAAGR